MIREVENNDNRQGKWIPCSERLPEYPGVYMTTLDYGKHGLSTGARYYHGKYFKWMNECVIAWMPLPDPYKALEEPKVKNRERLTNAEWVDLLSEQFNISSTSAKEMLHVMMSVKKEDNFKKLFSQG